MSINIIAKDKVLNSMQEYFELYDKLYDITEGIELNCLMVCDSICEKKENVYLLPFENEFICRRLKLKSLPFSEHITLGNGRVDYLKIKDKKNKFCKFFMDNGCAVHGAQPVDCRSFPIFPHYTEESGLKFFIFEYCPVSRELSVEFVEKVTEIWEMLAEKLPAYWWGIYNADLPDCYTELQNVR